MPTYPGDPLTPGVGATPEAKRLDRKDATTIMKIPVLPISYADAQPLLAALTGPVAPSAWRGGLPITYRLGPGSARVHLRLEFNWDQTPLYDVIATLKGSSSPDEVRTINGHRVAPEGVNVINLAFDVTPAKFVSAFFTEKGAFKPGDLKKLMREDIDLDSIRLRR